MDKLLFECICHTIVEQTNVLLSRENLKVLTVNNSLGDMLKQFVFYTYEF